MELVKTFVVRVFVAANADAVPFCGVVEHAGTGRAEPFESERDLLSIVFHELGRELPERGPLRAEAERASQREERTP